MYVSITGNKGNQDVYIKQSYRKDNGKTSSRIYKKLGKYNDLLAQFSGDETAMMDWAKKEAEKETLLYNQRKERITVSFSPLRPAGHLFFTNFFCFFALRGSHGLFFLSQTRRVNLSNSAADQVHPSNSVADQVYRSSPTAAATPHLPIFYSSPANCAM